MGVPGLVIPNAGPAVGLWNALPIGTLSDDGYTLLCTIQGQEVNETDAFGMTLCEAIYRGQNWRVRLRGLEWKTGLLSILQQFGFIGANGTLTPFLANIGDRWTKYCQALVLTSILGNPPSSPQSLTALNAGYAPNNQSDFNITSKIKELPLEMVLLPYSTTIGSSTFNIPFSTTG